MGDAIQLRDPAGRPLAGQTAALLDGGDEAFPRMLAAIAAARRSVHLEVYVFTFDEVGARFVEALAEAGRRGVAVTVVVDGFGSARDSRYLQVVLGAAGCAVQVYHPLLSLLLGRWRRSHRKLLLVDGEVGFVGGLNIGAAYGCASLVEAPRAAPPPAPWLDLALELRGPVVGWLERRLAGARARPPAGPLRVSLSGLGGGRRLRRQHVKAVGRAKREVLLAHGYFIPDRRLVRSLTAAARRGVAVTLLLAGRSDVPFHRPATMRLYRQFLRAGVRIFEWRRSVHHAKALVVDGRRLLLGSFNLDPLSLSNLEVLVEVRDPAVARAGAAWIEAQVGRAREVTPLELAGRSRLRVWLLDRLGLLVARGAALVARLLARR
ncbi:MAG TPA: phospholipase D-like domain-containing protein [Anaeromyxobacteraceae bacterium]|jgi:cardiolipin synthase|nr:phospholipase D-like domain-containing protein [Anaeromyxobacteraceae bacterium]